MPKHKRKVLLIGAPGVGKTALVDRFVFNKFETNYQTTVGVNILTKDVEFSPGEICTLAIWDFGGEERFSQVRKNFYQGANGILAVFDLFNVNSFIQVLEWMMEIHEKVSENLPFVLIGNKTDLLETSESEVYAREAKTFAESRGSFYIETSAKDSTNVEYGFTNLTCQIFEQALKDLTSKIIQEKKD